MKLSKLEQIAVSYIKEKREVDKAKEELEETKENLINLMHQEGKKSISVYNTTLYLEQGREKITIK